MKICVYCQERVSTPTGDHIFARQFFREVDRKDLPKAPCCVECGAEKSSDEHYLTAVLPFGARHESALENLRTMVPKRLERNHKLHRALSDGLEISKAGIPTVLPLDPSSIERLFQKITVGLMWHHWGIYLPATHDVVSVLITPALAPFFEQLLAFKAKDRANVNLGKGTFEYSAAQGIGDPCLSVWRYEIYGGLQMTCDIDVPELVCSHIGCITGPRELIAGLLQGE